FSITSLHDALPIFIWHRISISKIIRERMLLCSCRPPIRANFQMRFRRKYLRRLNYRKERKTWQGSRSWQPRCRPIMRLSKRICWHITSVVVLLVIAWFFTDAVTSYGVFALIFDKKLREFKK